MNKINKIEDYSYANAIDYANACIQSSKTKISYIDNKEVKEISISDIKNDQNVHTQELLLKFRTIETYTDSLNIKSDFKKKVPESNEEISKFIEVCKIAKKEFTLDELTSRNLIKVIISTNQKAKNNNAYVLSNTNDIIFSQHIPLLLAACNVCHKSIIESKKKLADLEIDNFSRNISESLNVRDINPELSTNLLNVLK